MRCSSAVSVRASSACNAATSFFAAARSASTSARSASSDVVAAAVDRLHNAATSSPAAACRSAGKSGCSIRTRLFSRSSAQNSPSTAVGLLMLPLRTS